MPSPTWDEYLANARNHINQTQQALLEGAPLSVSPAHPTEPLTEDHKKAAEQLAHQYDELVAEVLSRMIAIKSRLSTMDRWNLHESPEPLFVNIIS